MDGQNYPKLFNVVGVLGDVWNGNEDTIYEPTWVIRKDEGVFYCPKPHEKWEEEDLKKISDHELDYFIWFPPEEHIGINPGELLYLTGHQIMERIEELIGLGLLDFSMHAWHSVGGGRYFADVMTPAAYDAFIASLKSQIWEIVEGYIGTGVEIPEPHIINAFKAYSALYDVQEDTRERHLRKGAYYWASKDSRQLEFESYICTFPSYDFFKDADEFRVLVEQRVQDLRAK